MPRPGKERPLPACAGALRLSRGGAGFQEGTGSSLCPRLLRLQITALASANLRLKMFTEEFLRGSEKQN